MRRIRSDTVKTGLNAEHPSYADDRYVHCKNCGFICNLDRDTKASRGSHTGDGVDYDSDTFTTTDPDGGTMDLSDPSSTAGCPLCGCMLYNE